ncbi:MAG: hypothetical protein E7269_02725 [Lachnospiraceae bacterium]|nr:hypothetical protein [Lachnospiraceae bacterium]
MREKKKKEKITYIDDGSTIADMSGLSGKPENKDIRPYAGFRDIWRTYWLATKMMLVPTLIAVGFLMSLFFIMTFLFSVA